MPLFVIANGVQQGRAFYLRPGVNRVGRSSENHFQVPDESVSNSHCEITLADEAILVRDLRSTNGTFIDGTPINQGRIRLGQMLQVGRIELRLEQTAPVETELDDAAEIRIPELPVEQFASATLLPDGNASCLNHSELPATYRCTQCAQTLCDSCVRQIRRLGGETLIFCPLCRGACEAICVALPQKGGSGRSLLKLITQKLKHPFPRSRSTPKAKEEAPP